MMYVPLRKHVKRALVNLADCEQRDPRYQAARMIEQALIDGGWLQTPLGEFPPPDDRAEASDS